MTPREKVVAMVRAIESLPASEMSGELRQGMELLGVVRGLTGVDPLGWLIPSSDAEADLLVDKAIAFLLELRGDDLPAFDASLYGEAR